MKVHRVSGFIALLALVSLAFGQETQGDARAADPLFITTTAQDNIYEIASSRLALQRAASEEVKNFAQTMIDHHTAATTELTAIAEELGVTLPADNTAMQQLMLNQLGTLEGAAFDSIYLEQQVLAHEAAVSAFTIASDAVQNGALQTFVSETLPLIQEHLQRARQLMQ